jgi:inositol polyphosphate 5-phosphatase INPP5A
MMTKWCLNNVEIDLVNIHLFHDPSNITACTRSPSIYSEYRKKALEYTIEKILDDNTCFVIFGDLNFRLDTSLLVKDFSQLSNTIEFTSEEKNDIFKLVYRDANENETFTIQQKHFKFHNDKILTQTEQLLKFNKELNLINKKLIEYRINFKPTYPFEETPGAKNDQYMESRCPSWCDRILFNEKLKESIYYDESKHAEHYNIIGNDACMGDHKVGLEYCL